MPVYEFECEDCGMFADFFHSPHNPPLESPCTSCGRMSRRLTAPSHVEVGHLVGGEFKQKPIGKAGDYLLRSNAKAFENATPAEKERYNFPKNRNKEYDPVTPKTVF